MSEGYQGLSISGEGSEEVTDYDNVEEDEDVEPQYDTNYFDRSSRWRLNRMAKSDKHAESSAKQYGGSLEDYLEIHEMMDSSKSAHADNRHRVIFHSAWRLLDSKIFGMDFDKMKQLQHKYQLPDEFLDELVELFKHNRQNGVHWKNSDGESACRDIAEQHILEDFRMRFIPSFLITCKTCLLKVG